LLASFISEGGRKGGEAAVQAGETVQKSSGTGAKITQKYSPMGPWGEGPGFDKWFS